MPKIIGRGRYVSETYPERRPSSGGGAIIRMGFDNSTEDQTYSSGNPIPVLRAAGVPLAIPLTGFQPGNLILIQFSVVAEDAVGSGPIDSQMILTPTIDLGAGPRLIHQTGPEVLSPIRFMITFMTAVVPVPAEITADPVVGLLGTFNLDSTRIRAYDVTLLASEIAASSITQAPTTFLDP